jgi:hypothetical protein
MIPEWKDAPEWANYRAMDSNGEWFWYECSPRGGFKSWLVSEGDRTYAGREPYWRGTKEARPVSSTKENTTC